MIFDVSIVIVSGCREPYPYKIANLINECRVCSGEGVLVPLTPSVASSGSGQEETFVTDGCVMTCHLPHVFGLLVVLSRKLTAGFPNHKKWTG